LEREEEIQKRNEEMKKKMEKLEKIEIQTKKDQMA